MERLTAREARRIALAAQGFGRAHPPTAGTARIEQVLHRLRVLQIDSVNVFARSHYLPVFARLGPYDVRRLDALVLGAAADRTEYWAHEAAFVPKADLGLFAFRMDRYRAKHADRLQPHLALAERLVAEIAERGPLAASTSRSAIALVSGYALGHSVVSGSRSSAPARSSPAAWAAARMRASGPTSSGVIRPAR